VNNIQARSGTPPIVEVRDESDKPVSGAEVVFRLPAAGPGGSFYGWMRTETVRTDDRGRAAASSFVPNDEEGRFKIEVVATAGKKSGTVTIGQSNVAGAAGAKAKRSRKTLWVVLGVAAVGAIAGGVAASRGGDNTTVVTTPMSVTAGPVTVAGPR
jgi:hypothetical protein